jgi:Na+-driven multidrug efflux pump
MLAVPMVIEMAMESIFAVADVFWVAHLGADAVATVRLTESMLTMIYTVAMGLSIGAMALVSRRIGQNDPDGARLVPPRSRSSSASLSPRSSPCWRRLAHRDCCA